MVIERYFPECVLIDPDGHMAYTWIAYFLQEQNRVDGAGSVTGPATSTSGHVALFADPSGLVLADGGALGTAAFQPTSVFQPADAKLTTIAAQPPALTAGPAPAGGIGIAAGAWSSAVDRDAAIALLNTIRTALIQNGILT
jgi:hypothetical protein